MKTLLVAKPGWQTTEFWLAFVPMVLVVLTMLGVDVTSEDVSGWIYAAAGLISGGYALGRSVVKAFRANNANTVVVSKNSTRVGRDVHGETIFSELAPTPAAAPPAVAPKKVTTDV